MIKNNAIQISKINEVPDRNIFNSKLFGVRVFLGLALLNRSIMEKSPRTMKKEQITLRKSTCTKIFEFIKKREVIKMVMATIQETPPRI